MNTKNLRCIFVLRNALFLGVRVKQRTYLPLVSATEMDIWQAILT